MLIQADFSQVPDVVKPVPSGIYDLQVDSVERKEPKAKVDGTRALGYNIVVSHSVVNNPNHNGRKITNYIFISTDPSLTVEERNRNLTPILRFAKAAGIPVTPQGLNPLEAQGKITKAQVTEGTYTDASSGQVKSSSNVTKYFIPGDAELGTPS